MTAEKLIIFLCLVMLGRGLAQMDAGTRKNIMTGIASGQQMLDALENLKHPNMFDTIPKMSGFLGAAGGLVSFVLIFIPEGESAELQYMMATFADINMKLDVLTKELDNIKYIIKWENQKSAYINDASKIIYGSEQFDHFLQDAINVRCTTQQDCLRKRLGIAESYQQALNIKYNLHTILRGTVNKTSVFGDPLLELIKTTYNCDVPKIDYFTNGILKLAFKAQPVILAHEKLTGSNYSIVVSMNDWLSMIYDLRSKANKIKNSCYQNIKKHMMQDIQEEQYQMNMDSNAAAVSNMKTTLDMKYPWVHWVVFAYGAYGGDNHMTFINDEAFRNMPKNKNKRKRNIIVTAQDKGTYLKQRVEFANALTAIARRPKKGKQNDAEATYNYISKELKKDVVWRYIKALAVLKSYDDFQFKLDDHHYLHWYNEELDYHICYSHCYHSYAGVGSCQRCNTNTYRFIAVFKSQEEINSVRCIKQCNNGECRQLPLTTHNYCECSPFYQGETCDERIRAELAANVESIVALTFQIPKLTDIYFEIKDTIGSSLNNVLSTVIALQKKIEKSFNDLEQKMTQQFHWSNLLTQYTDAITNLKYYLHRFGDLPDDDKERALAESTSLATEILSVDGVQKWLFELNFLFVGRSDFTLGQHDPLLIILMNHHKDTACTQVYRDTLDNAWSQLVLLQFHGYLMWIQALDIENKSSDWVMDKYKNLIAAQNKSLNEATCNMDIAFSSNLQNCTNGYYLHLSSVVENKCMANYYVAGSLTTTCNSSSSSCKACSCNPEGSSSQECSDLTGDCTCDKNHYKGKKCYDRDCVFSAWQSWQACTKSCDYGGIQTRIRNIGVHQAGTGKPCPSGLSATKGSRTCFKGCCSGQYHCSRTKKCIPSSQRCDYINNCGDYQDEQGCPEICITRYTNYNRAGKGNAVYLDRHRPDCGGQGSQLMQSFRLQRSGDNIRYEYECCVLRFKSLCSYQKVENSFTNDGRGHTYYLDRQLISCPNGFLNEFWLQRNSDHNHWRYEYYCCDVNSYYRRKMTCYTRQTSFTTGHRESYYLDRQHVVCDYTYFLQSFKLERSSDHKKWRYVYECCRIAPW